MVSTSGLQIYTHDIFYRFLGHSSGFFYMSFSLAVFFLNSVDVRFVLLRCPRVIKSPGQKFDCILKTKTQRSWEHVCQVVKFGLLNDAFFRTFFLL